jgi:hypothetical protein
MTELESKLLMAEATIDIIRTCKPEEKEFWIEMRRILLYASAEEFDKYWMKISEEDDFLEKMAKLSIQTNFVKMINEIGSRGDLAELENDGIFENPIKKENSDLCQITHLTENRIKRYNINGTKRV